MSTAKQQLGERIRRARAEKGWKQKHLAAQVEVEPITVSRWERGATTPDLDVVRVIAEATGKPLSYFVAGDADEATPDMAEAATRIEAAAERISAEADRIERMLAELRELAGG
jgi:transcriptional regulator with XRE-family HTH domain